MSFEFNSELQKYYCVCDKCNSFEFTGDDINHPEGWEDGNETTLFYPEIRETVYLMYGIYHDKIEYDKFHFCSQCVLKKEILQVFK